MASERWLVAGAGIRGIVGAYLLARRGHQVSLLDGAKTLGGVLYSSLWKGFYLDKGCHLFDNTHDRTTEVLLDLMGDNVAPVTVRYASVTNGVRTDEISIPDLGTYGEAAVKRVLGELREAVAAPQSASSNLQEVLDARFGPTAGGYLAAAAYKMYRAQPGQIDACAFPLTPFKRIRFLPDERAKALKADPALDERIAAASQSDPMRYYRDRAGSYPHRNFYPREHGLRGFPEQAEVRLRQLGVNLLLGRSITRLVARNDGVVVTLVDGNEITADRLLWTSGLDALEKLRGNPGTIGPYLHHVPMVLHYFVIGKEDEGPYTYLQDFDCDDHLFRASVPGGYIAGASNEGRSYVCAEAPTTMGSPEWENPESFADHAWQELRRHGVVRSERALDRLTVKVPTSYWIPRVGYARAAAKVLESLASEPRITCADDLVFSKNEIIVSLLKLLEKATAHA